MTGTSGQESILTKTDRIAKLAREAPTMSFTTLAHNIDIAWLREAYQRTRKDGAAGIDGQSAKEYEQRLEENLRSLLDRAKSGMYRAPPVRRVYIPKGDGKEQRPIGIPTFEDKVLQRAVVMVLEAVYEQDFRDCSYGFRPKRSAHEALQCLRTALMDVRGGWVVEVDIRKFFDSLDHERLREVLRRRVRDGVLLRLIGKWLNAGVLDGLELSYPQAGTPQGGVISPLLANVFLHDVIDEWFAVMVLPRLHGRAKLIRYADDFVMVFELQADASRVFEVLPKRLAKHGLALHPDKSRTIDFRDPLRRAREGATDDPGSFDFLGFTFHWGVSRRGYWVVRQRTSDSRLSRALHRVRVWCRMHRHDPLGVQQRNLASKLRGHYAYYGVTSNFVALARFYREVIKSWWKWLGRRSQRELTWARFNHLLRLFPLPVPRIVHSYVS